MLHNHYYTKNKMNGDTTFNVVVIEIRMLNKSQRGNKGGYWSNVRLYFVYLCQDMQIRNDFNHTYELNCMTSTKGGRPTWFPLLIADSQANAKLKSSENGRCCSIDHQIILTNLLPNLILRYLIHTSWQAIILKYACFHCFWRNSFTQSHIKQTITAGK